jgi:hypothetical protein
MDLFLYKILCSLEEFLKELTQIILKCFLKFHNVHANILANNLSKLSILANGKK